MTTKSLSLESLKQDNGTSLSKKTPEIKIEKEANGVQGRLNRNPFKFKTNHGYSKAASLKLLFEKLNFSAEELNTVRNNSLTFTKNSAKKFEKQSLETKVDVQSMLANTAFFNYRAGKYDFQGAEVPYGFPPDIAPQFDIVINQAVPFKHGHIHAEGDGDGIITQSWGGNADQYDSFIAKYKFNFTPPATMFYDFHSSIIGAGSYFLIADDGWFLSSKEASCKIDLQSWVYQELPSLIYAAASTPLPYILERGPDKEIFSDGDDNINKFDTAVVWEMIDFKGVLLYANIPVEIGIEVACTVMGKGEGSIADMNFSEGNGAIVCPSLRVTASV